MIQRRLIEIISALDRLGNAPKEEIDILKLLDY